MTHTLRVVAAGAVIGVLAVAGCSSSSKSSSSSSSSTSPTTVSSGSSASTGTTTAATAACQSVANLKTSISELAKPATLAGGKSGIQSALDSVKTNLDDVKSTLQSSDKPKLDAFQSSISDLQTALGNMNGLSGLSAVTSAATNVVQSGQDLLNALKAGCPSS